jgi:hypothetical protein
MAILGRRPNSWPGFSDTRDSVSGGYFNHWEEKGSLQSMENFSDRGRYTRRLGIPGVYGTTVY